MVYWKACSILIYDRKGRVIGGHPICDGEGNVPRGVML